MSRVVGLLTLFVLWSAGCTTDIAPSSPVLSVPVPVSSESPSLPQSKAGFQPSFGHSGIDIEDQLDDRPAFAVESGEVVLPSWRELLRAYDDIPGAADVETPTWDPTGDPAHDAELLKTAREDIGLIRQVLDKSNVLEGDEENRIFVLLFARYVVRKMFREYMDLASTEQTEGGLLAIRDEFLNDEKYEPRMSNRTTGPNSDNSRN